MPDPAIPFHRIKTMPCLAFAYKDNNLFSAEGDVPRIGEIVYLLIMPDIDQKEFDSEALKEQESISGKCWEVVDIHREYRKWYIFQPPMMTEIVHVFVKPVATNAN